MFQGRLFVHAKSDPYALVPLVTRIIRDLSSEQPVEQAATLEDVRMEVLARAARVDVMQALRSE